MKPRKFHIWEFPEDKIRVLFKNHKDFILRTLNHFGSIKDLSKFLNISYGTVWAWKIYNLYIPLWAIKKIIKKLNLNWYQIEKEIIAYKGVNTSEPVKEPILPVKENPELFAIIAHLIGDGSVNKNKIPVYTNSNKDLINSFDNLIKKTFGDTHKSIRKIRRGCYQYCSSKVIVEIIQNFYDLNFDSKNGYFPKRTFKLSNKFIYAIIRAIVDDEGAVRENRIVISMNNKKLMFQLKDLFVKVFGKYSIGILHSSKERHYFSLRSKYLKKFKNRINLVHKTKKEDLNYAIKKSKIRYIGKGEKIQFTKNRILELLKRKELTTKEIAQTTFINTANINIHLKQLKERKLVKKSYKTKHSYIWDITPAGLNFLSKRKINMYKENRVISPDLRSLYSLPEKDFKIILSTKGLKKLFWTLDKTFKNQTEISKLLNVHRNTISYWKKGHPLPINMLNKILSILGKHGINATKEVTANIIGIRPLNNRG